MTRLLANMARLAALLALIAALAVPALPGFAAVAQAGPTGGGPVTIAQAAADCAHGAPAPAHHPSGGIDCCTASLCGMTLALPAHTADVVTPPAVAELAYDLRSLLQPLGTEPAPTTHPPKTVA